MAHKQNYLVRITNEWCNRLLGAVSERSLGDQEEQYASHRTRRDFVCTSIGVGMWGMVFPLLTIVVTQLVGAEQAGMFSMAFITGLVLMFMGNYGVRTFQVSDLSERYAFSDYQVNRVITCIVMMVVGVAYCFMRGYDGQMFTICMGVYLYKMVDALADVYEGRLQQADKMYLAGLSQALRSVAVVVVFSLSPTRHAQPRCSLGRHGGGGRCFASRAHASSRVFRNPEVAPLEPERRRGAAQAVLPSVRGAVFV